MKALVFASSEAFRSEIFTPADSPVKSEDCNQVKIVKAIFSNPGLITNDDYNFTGFVNPQ